MFPIYVFRLTFCDGLKLLKGKRLKSERKLQAYPYCRVSLGCLSVCVCLAALVDFQTTVCQEVLIFTINILIYSFLLSSLIFFLSLSYYAALTLSQQCWRAMGLEHPPSPLPDSRTWYSNHRLPSAGGDACTASLCRGEFLCRIHLHAGNLMGCKVRLWRLFFFFSCWSSLSF